MTSDRNQRLLELNQFRQALQTLRTGTTHLKHLLRVLYDRACLLEESWDCWVSKQALAAELEVSVKTVERSISLGEAQGFFLIAGFKEQGRKYCFRLRPAEIRDQWRQQEATRSGGTASASQPGMNARRPGGIASVAADHVEGRPGGIASGPQPRGSRTVSPLPTGTDSPNRETRCPDSETVSPENGTDSPKSETESLTHFGQVGVGSYINFSTNLANKGGTESLGTVSLKWPEIAPEELADPRRIEQLFRIAVARRWVQGIDRLRVFTVAVSVRRRFLHPEPESQPIGCPGAVFTKLVKRKHWVGGDGDEEVAGKMMAGLDQLDRPRQPVFEDEEDTRRREEQIMALAAKGRR